MSGRSEPTEEWEIETDVLWGAVSTLLIEADVDQLAYIVGPVGHPIVRHGECSVLIVR